MKTLARKGSTHEIPSPSPSKKKNEEKKEKKRNKKETLAKEAPKLS